MTTRTRRRLLAALGGLTCGLAGCAGESVESTQTVSSETPRMTIPENASTDPPMLVARSTATRPPIRLRDDQAGDDEEPSGGTGTEYQRRLETNELIDTQATADRLVAGTGVDSTGTDTEGVSPLVAATDFETETLYLETNRIKQCFRLSLCYVSWEDDDIRTAYSRRLRPYDAECAAGEETFESRLFRLPVALDAESITGLGTSVRSGECVRTRAAGRNGTRENTTETNGTQQATEGST